jgi:Cu(I)/Ag(I) efflux system membrane fusion protein
MSVTESLPNTTEHHGAADTPRRSWRVAGKLLLVRLRFPAILVIAFLFIGKWDVLRNYWNTFTRGALKDDPSYRAVSNDTEYFCPMDPGFVTDWPGKCGICNMGLVRRKRGEAVALPDGIVARMQLSPYRVQLAGIRVAPITYHPLALEAESSSIAERLDESASGGAHTVLARFRFPTKGGWLVGKGQKVTVTCPDLPSRPAFEGEIRDFTVDAEAGETEVLVELADSGQEIRPGMILSALVRRPIADVEPFRSMPSDLPSLKKGELRALFICPEHPERISERAGRCPLDKNELERRALSDNQRVGYWCPMHPEVTADHAGERCEACGGMILHPRIITFRPPGQVLGVPDSAVVDTGARQVVFVERMQGMFDGVEVALGTRCGDYYPVIRGLEPGERIAIAGAFLLDAETRLNPSLAASYFGAGARPQPGGNAATVRTPEVSSNTESATTADALAELPPADRALARKQATCPVTRKPLGSMGTPFRIELDGKPIFLCCDGCEDALRAQPAKYLGRAAASTDKNRAGPAAKSRP